MFITTITYLPSLYISSDLHFTLEPWNNFIYDFTMTCFTAFQRYSIDF